MHERADRLAGSYVTVDPALAREFEARLVESSTLAFRVAFSVLRQREDAEDVAQEAFAKAYRSFNQLRDRDRFRAWLVRMTWRMALDRQRANRRRFARESLAGDMTRGGIVEASLQTRLELERAEQLWQAIDALPEKLRLVIVLAGIEGHDTVRSLVSSTCPTAR
jgi:RNA polymerase sigma-70 factor (ECF subfamily)